MGISFSPDFASYSSKCPSPLVQPFVGHAPCPHWIHCLPAPSPNPYATGLLPVQNYISRGMLQCREANPPTCTLLPNSRRGADTPYNIFAPVHSWRFGLYPRCITYNNRSLLQQTSANFFFFCRLSKIFFLLILINLAVWGRRVQ